MHYKSQRNIAKESIIERAVKLAGLDKSCKLKEKK